jgi:hypothetical protein
MDHNDEVAADGDGPPTRAGVAGTLIVESLRVGADLDVPLAVDRIRRIEPADTTTGQPAVWTLLEFRVAEDRLDQWVEQLADGLQQHGGWYCDLRTDAETLVIFAGRVFRYPRGDPAGRAGAQHYGRSVGVPESQLDWPL